MSVLACVRVVVCLVGREQRHFGDWRRRGLEEGLIVLVGLVLLSWLVVALYRRERTSHRTMDVRHGGAKSFGFGG